MAVALAALLAVSLVILVSAPAGAVRHYANCTQLRRDHEYGVAKNRRAAQASEEEGYGYPRVSRRLYRANRDLDANDDGVACEA
jgi:hypothetical protein